MDVVHPRIDNTVISVFARTFRWRRLSESGKHASIHETADAENINPSCVSRVLRTTPLALGIVEEILAGLQPDGLTMERAMERFRVEWRRQLPEGVAGWEP